MKSNHLEIQEKTKEIGKILIKKSKVLIDLLYSQIIDILLITIAILKWR